MIVCSCNVFSDHQVRSVVAKEARRPRMSEVYAGLGCSAQCGRCAHASGSWTKSPAPFTRTQACTNAFTVALLAAGKAQIVGVKQRRVPGDERCWSMLAAPAEKRLNLIL